MDGRAADSLSPLAKRLGAVAAVAAVAALIFVFSIPVCPTARILRIPCPGCGLSRATHALLTGQFAEALRLHPLVFLIVPIIGGYIAGQGFAYLVARRTWVHRVVASRWIERIMIVLMVLAVALWVARFFGAFGGPVPV